MAKTLSEIMLECYFLYSLQNDTLCFPCIDNTEAKMNKCSLFRQPSYIISSVWLFECSDLMPIIPRNTKMCLAVWCFKIWE